MSLFIRFSLLEELKHRLSSSVKWLRKRVTKVVKRYKTLSRLLGFALLFGLMLLFPPAILAAALLLVALNIWSPKGKGHFFTFAILLVLFYFAVDEMKTDRILIEAITVPENYSAQNPGYNSEVLTKHLADAIFRWQKDTLESMFIENYRTNSEIKYSNNDLIVNKYSKQARLMISDAKNTESILQTTVMGFNYSPLQLLNYLKLNGYLRKFFGYRHYVISGELTGGGEEKSRLLTLRVRSFNSEEIEKIEFKGNSSLDEAVAFILTGINPTLVPEYYIKEEKYEKALHSINLIMEREGPKPEYYNIKGVIYSKLHKQSEAIENYKMALELDENFYISYYNLAMSYYKNEEYDPAIDLFTKAIKSKADFCQAYFKKAWVHYDKEQYRLAIIDFNNAIERNFDYAFAYNCLGNTYYMLGEYNNAKEMYNKAIELEPNCSKYYNAYNNLGTVYHKEGDYPKAIEMYSKALTIDPDYGFAYYNLAKSYEAIREYEKAIITYERAGLDIPIFSLYNRASDRKIALDMSSYLFMNLRYLHYDSEFVQYNLIKSYERP